MDKRIKEKWQGISYLCLKILSLCLEIDSKDKYHMFFDYVGHVNGIEVRILPATNDYSGYDYGYLFYKVVYVDVEEDMQVVINKLDKIYNELQRFNE